MRRFMFGFAMFTIATCMPMAARADQVQDKQIAQQVIQRLQTEKSAGELKGFNLDLQVEEGTLWMSGRVASQEQQDKVLDIARRVPGVKQVVNDLTITKAAESPVKQVSGMSLAPANTKSVLVSNNGKPKTNNAYVPTAGKRTTYGTPTNYGQPAPSSRPVAFAPARPVNYQQPVMNAGAPQPMHMPSSGVGVSPARYDHPQMPGYAWPSYASSPNYAGVSYPKQYSASAWPYIGPFYPYPQVPLGWRKVSMEWDDGWWWLDFKDRH
jgi:BON domain